MQSKKYKKIFPNTFLKKNHRIFLFLTVNHWRLQWWDWDKLLQPGCSLSAAITVAQSRARTTWKTNYSSPLAWKHPVVHSAVFVVLRSTFLFCEWNDNRAAILFWLFSGCSCSWLIRGWRPVTTRPSLRADTTSIYMKAPQWEDLIKVKVTVCQAVKWGSSARLSRPWLRCFHLVCLRI